MADLATFAWGGTDYLSVVGTVTANATWVHAVGTVTVNPALPRYGVLAADGTPVDLQSPGYCLAPYDIVPFARLDNPPYGARIFYANDPYKPNAMTELDGSYMGVARDADFPQRGKFLNSQVRSPGVSLLDADPWTTSAPAMGLGGSGIAKPYTWTTVAPWITNPDWVVFGDEPAWIRGSTATLTRTAWPFEIPIISRSVYTYMCLRNALGPPGIQIDFDIMWWNGPGFRCSDTQRVMVD